MTGRILVSCRLPPVANTYFQFKQFTVHQEHCAMKVCTDACLFGAWLANQFRGQAPEQILDIGAGTGLLSLMLAQSVGSTIDAIEIDESAAGQATSNFNASPWKERLHLLQGDAREITTGKKYDLIVTNPPFFENDLKSADQQRNLALHSSELDLNELLRIAETHLTPTGNFAVLLPFHRKKTMLELAEIMHFFLVNSVDVKQTTTHSFFRTMLLFGRDEITPLHSELAIREDNNYTAAFTRLLKAYYLHL
ncbi:methyltransferase [Sediminibacterium roseum]|uniref:tRNA1(Val) (adenine(37)-N6)-methyltransferase n=1 Tax=Sediminibacterium roseum TaxID=1978412 RepID=A0ABW9ZTH0_9BACT|nr:methyltransferase [Sediminibacterium roseum]NCI50410.1 methyltransferase [Sediminibacterium roseum]